VSHAASLARDRLGHDGRSDHAIGHSPDVVSFWRNVVVLVPGQSAGLHNDPYVEGRSRPCALCWRCAQAFLTLRM